VAHFSIKLWSFGQHGCLVFQFDKVLRVRSRNLIRGRDLLVVDSPVFIVSFLVESVDFSTFRLPVSHVRVASSFTVLFSQLQLSNGNFEVGRALSHAFTSVSSCLELLISKLPEGYSLKVSSMVAKLVHELSLVELT